MNVCPARYTWYIVVCRRCCQVSWVWYFNTASVWVVDTRIEHFAYRQGLRLAWNLHKRRLQSHRTRSCCLLRCISRCVATSARDPVNPLARSYKGWSIPVVMVLYVERYARSRTSYLINSNCSTFGIATLLWNGRTLIGKTDEDDAKRNIITVEQGQAYQDQVILQAGALRQTRRYTQTIHVLAWLNLAVVTWLEYHVLVFSYSYSTCSPNVVGLWGKTRDANKRLMSLKTQVFFYLCLVLCTLKKFVPH